MPNDPTTSRPDDPCRRRAWIRIRGDLAAIDQVVGAGVEGGGGVARRRWSAAAAALRMPGVTIRNEGGGADRRRFERRGDDPVKARIPILMHCLELAQDRVVGTGPNSRLVLAERLLTPFRHARQPARKVATRVGQIGIDPNGRFKLRA